LSHKPTPLWATHSLPTRHTRPLAIHLPYMQVHRQRSALARTSAVVFGTGSQRHSDASPIRDSLAPQESSGAHLYPNRNRARLHPRHLGVQTVDARRPSRSCARRWGRASMLGWEIERSDRREAGRVSGRNDRVTRARKTTRPSHPCSATGPRARQCLTSAPPPGRLRRRRPRLIRCSHPTDDSNTLYAPRCLDPKRPEGCAHSSAPGPAGGAAKPKSTWELG